MYWDNKNKTFIKGIEIDADANWTEHKVFYDVSFNVNLEKNEVNTWYVICGGEFKNVCPNFNEYYENAINYYFNNKFKFIE